MNCDDERRDLLAVHGAEAARKVAGGAREVSSAVG